jgi:hypothetical protein
MEGITSAMSFHIFFPFLKNNPVGLHQDHWLSLFSHVLSPPRFPSPLTRKVPWSLTLILPSQSLTLNWFHSLIFLPLLLRNWIPLEKNSQNFIGIWYVKFYRQNDAPQKITHSSLQTLWICGLTWQRGLGKCKLRILRREDHLGLSKWV